MHANAPSGREAGASLEAGHRRIDHSGPSACIPSDPRASALNPACLASWLRREAAPLTALRTACTGHRLRHHWHVRATQCRIGSASRWLSVRFDRTGPQPWWRPEEVGGRRKTFASCGDFDRLAVQKARTAESPVACRQAPLAVTDTVRRSRRSAPARSQVILVPGNVREAFDQQAGLGRRPGGDHPGGGAVTGSADSRATPRSDTNRSRCTTALSGAPCASRSSITRPVR